MPPAEAGCLQVGSGLFVLFLKMKPAVDRGGELQKLGQGNGSARLRPSKHGEGDPALPGRLLLGEAKRFPLSGEKASDFIRPLK